MWTLFLSALGESGYFLEVERDTFFHNRWYIGTSLNEPIYRIAWYFVKSIHEVKGLGKNSEKKFLDIYPYGVYNKEKVYPPGVCGQKDGIRQWNKKVYKAMRFVRSAAVRVKRERKKNIRI